MPKPYLAIVNLVTGKVENIVVPWAAPEGYLAVSTTTGSMNDTYIPETGEFVPPVVENPEDAA